MPRKYLSQYSELVLAHVGSGQSVGDLGGELECENRNIFYWEQRGKTAYTVAAGLSALDGTDLGVAWNRRSALPANHGTDPTAPNSLIWF